MHWYSDCINKRKMRPLGIAIPTSKKYYSRKARLLMEEHCRFRNVRFSCRALDIGAHSYMRGGNLEMVDSIGRYCSIGKGVLIGLNPHEHPADWLSTHPFQFNGQTGTDLQYRREWQGATIGHDVWIGQDALIMKGVTIGHGAIIGARSVVTRDVAAYQIVAGVPAAIIRPRFPEPVRAELARIRWWQWSPAQLADVPFTDIDAALAKLAEKESRLEPWQPAQLRARRVDKRLRLEAIRAPRTPGQTRNRT